MPLILTPLLTLFVFALAAVCALADVLPPVAALHLALAGGILPLIGAAIIHFVPVLTRSAEPSPFIALWPELVRLCALPLVAAMAGWLGRPVVYLVALCLAALGGVLLAWVGRRARLCLGAPHPGWRWYGLALGCFIAAMLAVVAMFPWPEAYLALRLLHLHLNLLGLVGLAALGTLPVLLPTALGQPDPAATGWLKRRAGPAGAAVLLLAVGAAVWPLPAALGGALLLLLIGELLRQWRGRFGWRVLLRDGVARSLLVATVNFALLLLVGTAQGLGGWQPPALALLAAWTLAFLLPLVSGALAQLLPVWCWPGPARPERGEMRRRLLFGCSLRLACLSAAGAAALLDQPAVVLPAALAGALILLGVIRAMHVRPSAR